MDMSYFRESRNSHELRTVSFLWSADSPLQASLILRRHVALVQHAFAAAALPNVILSERHSFFGKLCLYYARRMHLPMQAALVRFAFFIVGLRLVERQAVSAGSQITVITTTSVDSLYIQYGFPILYRIGHMCGVPLPDVTIPFLPLSALQSPTAGENRILTMISQEPMRWFPIYYDLYTHQRIHQEIIDCLNRVFGITLMSNEDNEDNGDIR